MKRTASKTILLILCICLVISVCVATVFAEENTVGNISVVFINSSHGTDVADVTLLTGVYADYFLNNNKPVDMENQAIGNKITFQKPDNVVVVNGTSKETWECKGYFIYTTSNRYDKSNSQLTSFGDNGTAEVTLAEEHRYNPNGKDSVKNKVQIYLGWERISTETLQQYTVTYDLNSSAVSDATIFPLVSGFRAGTNEVYDKKVSELTGISSLAFFTAPASTNNLRYISDTFPVMNPNNITGNFSAMQQTVIEGESVSVGMGVEQRRVPQIGMAVSYEPSARYYPVVGMIARKGEVGNYTYYKLDGWKIQNGEDTLYKMGDEYTPTAATKFVAQWSEITGLPTEHDSTAPIAPLLKDNKVTLAQKTYGSAFITDPVSTDYTDAITYQISMQFSDILNSIEMPWGNNTHFKNIDNEKFADVKVHVTLDQNLEPVKGEDGKTTIIIRNSSLKVTGVTVGETQNTDIAEAQGSTQTITVDLGGSKSFTIDFAWKGFSSSEMKIEIPTKVVSGYTGEISRTTVTVDGKFDFANAYTASAQDDTKASFEPDQLVRYILALDESWNEKYGGENMTVEQMLSAAKELEFQLSNVQLSSNSVTATASVDVDDLTVETDNVTLNVGDTRNINAHITPDNAANKEITWSVVEGGEQVVRVDTATGAVTGLKPGTAQVKASSVYNPNKSATVTVTVKGLIQIQQTVGGTVTASPEYAGKDELVTLTVTPAAGYTLVSESLTATYGETKVTLTPVEDSTTEYTFNMPEASPVIVDAAFVGSENTVVDLTGKTTDSTSSSLGGNQAQVYNKDYREGINVELSDEALNNLMDQVAGDSSQSDVDYTASKAASLLSSSNKLNGGTAYRHLQTRTNVALKKYDHISEQGRGVLTIDISFMYRVVASTDALNPAESNSEVMSSGEGDETETAFENKGWVEYEGTENTYITVPLPEMFGKDGDWVKIEHDHNGTPSTSYAQIENGQIRFTNQHGFSDFVFTNLTGLNDIIFGDGENAGSIGFVVDEKEYRMNVDRSVSSIVLTPVYASGVHSNNKTATVSLNGVEVDATNDSSGNQTFVLELDEGSNKVEVTYNDQTYTITVYRGTSLTPPSTYTVKTNEVENAEVETSAATATAGTDITVTVTPAENYHVSGVTVTASNGAAVAVTDNKDGTYSFKMPASNVTVTAEVYECPSLAFPDIDLTRWYHEYTDYAISHGLMEGTGAGFEPETLVTRAQMAYILWNLSNNPEVEAEIPFTDVPANEWYTEAIRWAASVEVISGCGDGTFKPDENINREQMAMMLYNYEQKIGSGGFAEDETYTLTFDDAAEISTWAQEAVAWCTMKGVIKGSDNKFTPANTAKRSDLATILSLYDRLAK